MLRPVVAFLALAAAAFLLAPTVASVHRGVEDLDIRRTMPWQIWKWDRDPTPPELPIPDCDEKKLQLYSEVTRWPKRIDKNETFTLGGIVVVPAENGRGVSGIEVDLFLNETKEAPGIPLGSATSADGKFTLHTSVPFELEAERYHLVAYANPKRVDCTDYLEHWSDPEMDVVSPTRILWDEKPRAVVGHPFNLSGRLVDSVGAPVRGATIFLDVGSREYRLETDQSGYFRREFNSSEAGTLRYTARYPGTEHYGDAEAEGSLRILAEDLRIDQAEGREGLQLVRSEPTTLTGALLLPNQAKPRPFTLTFTGVNLSTCAECPAGRTVHVTPEADGRFTFTLYASPDEEEGPFSFRASGGGLEEPKTYPGTLQIPVVLGLDASAAAFFTGGIEGTVRLTDEVGRALEGDIALQGPAGWHHGALDADGRHAFQLAGECGAHEVVAYYNGTASRPPATTATGARACTVLSFIPAWALAAPWWVWPLAALAALAGWIGFQRLRERYAATIRGGPPLRVAFTLPDDAAAGIVGVGEPANLTAYLEEPLPEGHTLRMGTHHHTDAVEIGPDLRGELPLSANELGRVPLRAEIVGPRGRVVSRRTAYLKVVRYAEEIEERYLALQHAQLGEAAAAVSPREFERWLRERGLGGDAAARLVALFEEADYSPRDATRADLLAYIQAESGVPEVSARVAA